MGKVIKKGGSKKETFDPKKIKRSVERAAKDAKVSPAKKRELLKEVVEPTIEFFKKKKEVKAPDLRRAILGRIERRSKAVFKAWKKFEKKK